MVSNVRAKLGIACVVCLVAIESTGCRYPVPARVPRPPRATDEVRLEMYALEGSTTCLATRDFLLDEVAPYFASIDAINSRWD